MRLDVTRLFKFLGVNTQGDLGPYTFYTDARRNLVWFIKAPPLEPPSYLQGHQRNKWRAAIRVWRSLLPTQRIDWQRAAQRTYLRITGYNLFIYSQTVHDPCTIATVEKQSRISLQPPYSPPIPWTAKSAAERSP